MRHIIFRISTGVLAIFAGIYFRDFWKSPWGPPTFLLLLWIAVTAVMSWRGKGKPLSLKAGLIFSTATTASIAVGGFVNVYVGVAMLVFWIWLGMKTGFFGRLAKE